MNQDRNHTQRLLALYREAQRELHAFLAARLHNREQAADVAQEAFAQVLAAGAEGSVADLRGYLFRTAANLSVDELRRREVRNRHAATAATLENPGGPDPARTLAGREQLALLRQAIDELPPRCREVFLLHRFRELSYPEIAAQLGISRNMVEKHIVRALAHCRARLEGGGSG
ncbi:RNA polymerase sigma factor [Thioalbus denitrificans]|uniref:RNA polymerase sigma-70 factor (ECF subfamily) n=1 Tax=Thioalbus denitrificans TaxID=547122 RepID=A0A369C0Z3_9GAMM|nr:sigma-70 family RNA polymerase sigma factor [Thioalbus denitrificans]RCX26337.1 RNA polymerase sigma-70 factor (ECF subfamily) [Thioalbus denitrificans]